MSAREASFSEQPALIVVDLAMPIMEGWTATRILRSDPRTKAVPIIVVTGNSTPNQLEEARLPGGDLILKKPCTPTALMSAIESMLRGEPLPPDFSNGEATRRRLSVRVRVRETERATREMRSVG